MKTFRIGGVHPEENKLSADQPIKVAALPEVAVFPLGQHIGAPAKAVVAKGDKVKVGTMIAEAGGFVSAGIYSSVSGTVQKIDTVIDASGYRKPAIYIKVEGDEWEETIDRSEDLVKTADRPDLTPELIVEKIKNGEEVSVPAVLMLQGEAEVAPAKGDEGEDDGIVKATNTIIFPSISDALDKAPGMGVSTEVGELPGDVFSGVNFMENGLYEVEGKVKVDQMGKLTITVKKDEVLNDDLFVVDNFRLLYLGEKDPSGVRGVLVDEGDAAADGKIFTVDGVQVKSANKPGLYIKNGKKFVVK